MQLLTRNIETKIYQHLQANKVIVLVGPRRVGKTVLLQQIIKKTNKEHLLLSGEDISVQEILNRRSVQNYLNLLGNKRLLIIDEAQEITDIGSILKLMVDQIDGLKVIITGSSAFDLRKYATEPLLDKSISYQLFALSEQELLQTENIIEKRDNLQHRLVYGNYPELIHLETEQEKAQYLKEIVNSYLLKDILAFDGIRNSDKILKLLKLIAYQVGSQVSLQELGQQLSMSKNTVERYLDLLSKVYIVHKVDGFSRNLRKEITKTSRWYFYDNGIRNTLIANLSPVVLRNDVGSLWENYIIAERIKYQHYNNMLVNNYFWRTYDQQEIDWVEERSGQLFAYEFKWNSRKKVKPPRAWIKAYEQASFEIITPDNYLEWIL